MKFVREVKRGVRALGAIVALGLVAGGVAIDGSVVGVRDSLNKAYYGKEVSPTDILVRGTTRTPKADPLLQAVGKLAAAK
jgi:lipid-binding SYLF domain-containing protein